MASGKSGTLKIELTKESAALIRKLVKKGLLDLRPIFKVTGISYRKSVKAVFERIEPRDASLKWKALSPKYAIWKNRHYPGQPILVLTGTLKASMITEGAPGNFTFIGKNNAIFGTDVPYGKYHDQGGGTLPKRNFSEPSERRKQIFQQQIERDIVRQVEVKAGIKVNTDKGLFE